MTPQQIALEILTIKNGKIVIDVSKAPESERDAIRQAKEVSIEGKTPEITILGDNGDNSVDDEGFSEEDSILRDINREMLSTQDAINNVQVAFTRFINTLLTDPEKYPLVRDEWNKYIVKHEETGEATYPDQAHHIKIVGLKPLSEGKDDLRDLHTQFIIQMRERFRREIDEVFEGKDDVLNHKNPQMNTPEARAISILQAEYSNFVRGAGYLRHRRGEDSLDGYAPRRLAANIIDETASQYTK